MVTIAFLNDSVYRRQGLSLVLLLLVFSALCLPLAHAKSEVNQYESHCANDNQQCIDRELEVITKEHRIPLTDDELDYVYAGKTLESEGVFQQDPIMRPLPKQVTLSEE